MKFFFVKFCFVLGMWLIFLLVYSMDMYVFIELLCSIFEGCEFMFCVCVDSIGNNLFFEYLNWRERCYEVLIYSR